MYGCQTWWNNVELTHRYRVDRGRNTTKKITDKKEEYVVGQNPEDTITDSFWVRDMIVNNSSYRTSKMEIEVKRTEGWTDNG